MNAPLSDSAGAPLRALASLLVALALVASGPAQTTRHVAAQAPPPGNGTAASPFPSIQTAIGVALPGDVVRVQPGVYVETLDFLGKAITVRSSDGAAVTVVDASGVDSVVRFLSGEGRSSRLVGFTLRGGDAGNGGGVTCFGTASPTIEGCIIRDNVAAIGGGGVSCFGGAPLLRDCDLLHNVAMLGGGGFACDSSTAELLDCRFVENEAVAGSGGAIAASNSNLIVRDSVFTSNQAGDAGGAIDLFNSGPTIEDCLFGGNQANFGGALANFSSSPTVRRSRFLANVAISDGGAMRTFSGTPVLADCVLLGNAANRGGALYTDIGSTQVVGSTIAGNTASSNGGGAAWTAAGTPAFTNCILWGNAPDQIDLVGSGALAVTFCAVQGGFAGLGNLASDPQLAGGGHIAATSPCRNAGSNAASAASPRDFEGNPRVLAGTVDIGADEFAPRLAGSGEDFELRSEVNGAGGTVTTLGAAAGALLRLEISSPGLTFAGRAPLVVGQLFLAGSPPIGPAGFPTIHLAVPGLFLVFDGASVPAPFGPVVVGPEPIALQSVTPPGLAGLVARVQALVLAPFAANGIFAVTDAHDVLF